MKYSKAIITGEAGGELCSNNTEQPRQIEKRQRDMRGNHER